MRKRYKTRAKKNGKTKGDKKPKREKKTIKCRVKKAKKRQGKNLTKGNKRRESKIKVLSHELSTSTLSYLMLAPW
jgi:hypothetical protein